MYGSCTRSEQVRSRSCGCHAAAWIRHGQRQDINDNIALAATEDLSTRLSRHVSVGSSICAQGPTAEEGCQLNQIAHHRIPNSRKQCKVRWRNKQAVMRRAVTRDRLNRECGPGGQSGNTGPTQRRVRPRRTKWPELDFRTPLWATERKVRGH